MKYLLIICFLTLSSGLYAETVKIDFETDPPQSQILPDAEMAQLKFKVTKEDGTPVDQARLHITLNAPKTNPLVSTDFPIVEGTQLMDIEVDAPNGKFNMDYLLPIRGTYELSVTASSLDGFDSFEAKAAQPLLKINEVPSEVGNLIVFLITLLIFGGLSGFILGRHQTTIGGNS